MERKLPTVTIHDTEFSIDLRKYELREVANPDNRIPLDKTWITDDATSIPYDKQTKNIFSGGWVDFLQTPHTDLVVLPPLIELDRIGLLETASTRELYDFEEKLNKGHRAPPPNSSTPRVLSTLQLEGNTFFVDARLGEFRNRDNPTHRISFNDTFSIAPGKMGLLYDPKTQNAFSGTREQWNDHKDLRLMEIPPLSTMMADRTGQMFHATSKEASPQVRNTHQTQLKRKKGRGI